MKEATISLGRRAWFLRYGESTPSKASRALITVRLVSKLLKTSRAHCSYALEQYLKQCTLDQGSNSGDSEPEQTIKVTASNITEAELDALTSTRALERQAEKSLVQRVGLFNSDHPGRKLTVHHLRKLFKEHGIKRKKVRRFVKSQLSADKQLEQERRFFQEFRAADDLGHEIVMVDECVFSSKTYQQQAWARRGENLTLSKRFKNMECMAAVAAISNRRGLIAYHCKPKSIKQADFAYFLGWMFKRLGRTKYTILLDQASIHRAQLSKETLEGKRVLFNIPYSPWYNGIELYWAQCKQIFRRNLLRQMIDRTSINLGQLTEDALEEVQEDKIKKCADSALKLIRLHAHEKRIN